MSDFESAFEQHEETEEARKGLEAFTRAMESHPDLVQQIMETQRAAYHQMMQEAGAGHVCRLCLIKQRFVRLVELITLACLLKSADDNLVFLYAIEWARRVPAVRLVSFVDLIPPALDLVKWCAHPDTAPQPDWYDTGPMDNEGGHE